ncbi:MAG: DUF4199 domain-containing protein [Flavobacteriia bacterium]|nr:DUF4199 domain-containing protein [Flavobacteriia bacterium]
MNQNMKKIALLYGGIMGVIGIAAVLYYHFADPKLYLSYWDYFLRSPFNMVILILAMLAYRKANGGYSEFRETFSAWMLPAMVGILSVALVKYVLLFHVNPEFKDKFPEWTREIQQEAAISLGATEEQIEVQQEQLSEAVPLTFKSFFYIDVMMRFMANALFGLLFAAAFTKRNPANFTAP